MIERRAVRALDTDNNSNKTVTKRVNLHKKRSNESASCSDNFRVVQYALKYHRCQNLIDIL